MNNEKQFALRILRDLRIRLMDMWDETQKEFEDANLINDIDEMKHNLSKMNAFTEAMHEVNAKLGELYGE